MPVPINTLPQGILGFLGIKNGGRYPQELGSLLSPVWDLAELYGYTNSLFRNDTVALAALGATTFATVPAGEAWWILQQDASSATLGAGQSLALGLQFTDAAGLVTMSVSDPSAIGATGQRVSVSLPRAYFVGPGSNLGVLATVFAAGPISVTLSTQYARFAL